jgi:hypothetical protein
VATVHAIEVADRERAGGSRFGVGQSAKNSHVVRFWTKQVQNLGL